MMGGMTLLDSEMVFLIEFLLAQIKIILIYKREENDNVSNLNKIKPFDYPTIHFKCIEKSIQEDRFDSSSRNISKKVRYKKMKSIFSMLLTI